MSLKRFCFEHNRYYLLTLGSLNIELHLYHDILDALEERWCAQILKLSAGNKVMIDFNDFTLKITPILNKILADCEFSIRGTGKDNYCTVYLYQLLHTMRNFIEEILGIAVKEGYVTAEDIAKHLG